MLGHKDKNNKFHPHNSGKGGVSEKDLNISQKGNNDTIVVEPSTKGMKRNRESDIKKYRLINDDMVLEESTDKEYLEKMRREMMQEAIYPNMRVEEMEYKGEFNPNFKGYNPADDAFNHHARKLESDYFQYEELQKRTTLPRLRLDDYRNAYDFWDNLSEEKRRNVLATVTGKEPNKIKFVNYRFNDLSHNEQMALLELSKH